MNNTSWCALETRHLFLWPISVSLKEELLNLPAVQASFRVGFDRIKSKQSLFVKSGSLSGTLIGRHRALVLLQLELQPALQLLNCPGKKVKVFNRSKLQNWISIEFQILAKQIYHIRYELLHHFTISDN